MEQAHRRLVHGDAPADELVLDALEMAIKQRQPSSVIHLSDQGCQYTSVAFGQRCAQAGIRPSMGSVGDCFDNAMCESFFATRECELLDRYRSTPRLRSRPQALRLALGVASVPGPYPPGTIYE